MNAFQQLSAEDVYRADPLGFQLRKIADFGEKWAFFRSKGITFHILDDGHGKEIRWAAITVEDVLYFLMESDPLYSAVELWMPVGADTQPWLTEFLVALGLTRDDLYGQASTDDETHELKTILFNPGSPVRD